MRVSGPTPDPLDQNGHFTETPDAAHASSGLRGAVLRDTDFAFPENRGAGQKGARAAGERLCSADPVPGLEPALQEQIYEPLNTSGFSAVRRGNSNANVMGPVSPE